MNHTALIGRLEEQAVEIAELKKQVASLTAAVSEFPERAEAMKTELLRSMADGPVNCGAYYGCAYARRLL